MANQTTEELSQEIIQKISTLIADADSAIEETNRLLSKSGLKRGDLSKGIEVRKKQLSEEELRQFENEETQWQQELERDIELALQETGFEKKKAPKLRPNMMPV